MVSSYYLTTMGYNPVKGKGLARSKEHDRLVTTMLLHYYVVVTTKNNHTTIFFLIINMIYGDLFVVSKNIQKSEK